MPQSEISNKAVADGNDYLHHHLCHNINNYYFTERCAREVVSQSRELNNPEEPQQPQQQFSGFVLKK